MDRGSSTVLRRGLPRLPRLSGLLRLRRRARVWEIWALPARLRAFVLTVICADLAWIGLRAADFRFDPGDLALFAGLLACAAVTVELSRRGSEPTGVVKDVHAVWELPVVLLLPPLYALVMPAIRLALVQWRVRQAPAHRRVFTASAMGVAYGCASVAYHAFLPAGVGSHALLRGDPVVWLAAAAAAAATQWAVNEALVLTALKAAVPATRLRDLLFTRETLHDDVTELGAAVLAALGLTITPLTLVVALPLATSLHRSFRHDQLLHAARADAKTGLLNSITWEREAAAEVARAVRTRSPLAVALLDLDRFKLINDTYGHLLGDRVLKHIAGTMTEVLREYDLAGRFGGEEFAMLLPQTRAVDAFRIAERVRAHISQLPLYADGWGGTESVRVTVSIGVAALDAGSRRELTELLAAADAALYRAKASGRDQVQMISTSRGLSAFRPATAGTEPDAEAGADAGRESGDAWLPEAQLPEAQLPEEGNETTATTSAVAV